MASGGLVSISSSKGYEPNIVGNNSEAEMIAKNHILHKSLESAINQRLPNDRGRAEQGLSTEHGTEHTNRNNFVLDVQHTLSEQIAFWHAQGRNALHYQRARFEDAARQFERTERDEAQVVGARATAQVTAGMQPRTQTSLEVKNVVSPADVAASGDEFRSSSSSINKPGKQVGTVKSFSKIL